MDTSVRSFGNAHGLLARLDAQHHSVRLQWMSELDRARAGGPLADVFSLCDLLGIAPEKEAEVYECGRLGNGLWHYGAWWHFVGQIEVGPRWEGSVFKDEFLWRPSGADEPRLTIHGEAGLVPDAFDGEHTLQLEVFAELPWVLDDEPTS